MPWPFDTSSTAEQQLITITASNLASEVVLCVLTGDVDLATGPQLKEKLIEALHPVPSHLVIDLTDVEFLGSAGLQILVDTQASQQAAGYHMAVVVGNNRVATRPLHITGLDQTLDLHTELTTAVEACQTHPTPSRSHRPPP